MVTNNQVINEPIYFNLFECGKNLLNKLDATCKGACMATSRDKYYKEMFKTLTDLMTATIRQYPTQRFKKQYVKSLKRNQ